jgi:hypothetical protein
MSESLPECIGDSIISCPEGKELLFDFTEFGIDQLLEDGLLKDIPWVGWIIKCKSVYTSISDRILLAKIARFLFALHSHSWEQRNEILERITSTDDRRKIGEQVLIALEKTDALEKADLLGKVFSYYVRGLLSEVEHSRLVDAVIKCHTSDLKWFFHPTPYINYEPDYERLLSSGLARFKDQQNVETRFDNSIMKVEFELSPTAQLLFDITHDRLDKRPDSKRRIESNLGKI